MQLPNPSNWWTGWRENDLASCARIFWTWLIARTLVWPLVVFFAVPNPPMDVIEVLMWGREWQFGYHKHPPLSAWLAEIFFQASGESLFGVYLGSYVCVALTMWAVWRLARELLSPSLALLAVFAMEAIPLYGWLSFEFNCNVVLTACWAHCILWLFLALKTQSFRYWALFGVSVGLGFLTKYSLAFLAMPILAFLLIDPRARRVWATPGPYLAGCVGVVIISPHLIWLASSDYSPASWALRRTESEKRTPTGGFEDPDVPPTMMPRRAWDRLENPANFLGNQLLYLAPLGLLFAFGLKGMRPADSDDDAFNRRFLASLVLGPFGLLLALSLAMGFELRGMWGMPIWAFAGLAGICFWNVRPARETRLIAAFAGCMAVFTLVMIGQGQILPTVRGKTTRLQFPGRQLAEEVTRRWHVHEAGPLPATLGGFWLAGNVSVHSAERPTTYASPYPDRPTGPTYASPWRNDDMIQSKGGVILWDAHRYGPGLPASLRRRFPSARLEEPIRFASERFPRSRPAHIGIALILPAPDGRAAKQDASP
ncbi:MAG: glycosyltransferase family 39 protein [Planctomycetes bacterium]|nr:glycosyltransferase family 39 protein [Planctomycetota bacterium]